MFRLCLHISDNWAHLIHLVLQLKRQSDIVGNSLLLHVQTDFGLLSAGIHEAEVASYFSLA